MTPGRKFSHTTSALAARRLTISIASGFAQVERDAALVAVHAERKDGAIFRSAHFSVGERAARLVALVRLDLDDVGAEQRELVGAVGAGEVAGEVEDADAGERLAHDPRAWPCDGLHLFELLLPVNSARAAISSGESRAMLE